jgi:hypothetical protein
MPRDRGRRGRHDGACWAVISARWHQYIFGFYPPDVLLASHPGQRPAVRGLAPVLYWNDRKAAILTGVAGGLTVLVDAGAVQPGMVRW